MKYLPFSTSPKEMNEYNTIWKGYVDFLVSGKAQSYSRKYSFCELTEDLSRFYKERHNDSFWEIINNLALSLTSARLIRLFIQLEVEELSQEKINEIAINMANFKSRVVVSPTKDGLHVHIKKEDE